jgi:hypothetical protein
MELVGEQHTGSSPPSTSLYAVVARKAPVAVVFRRGPARQVELLRWDVETDTVEAGQWLKGRVHECRADLSPDGSLLVYFESRPAPDAATRW